MAKLLFSIFFFLFFLGTDCFSQSSYDTYINNRVEYFSEYLSSFPPNVKDSVEASILEHQLLAFIDTVISLREAKALQDDEQYYLWMGKLYHYGYNLDIPGSWSKSEIFFNNVLEINPKSTDARMELASHYGNSWNPGDTSTYKRIYKGFSLLKSIYRDGNDTLNSALYHNLLYFGLCLRAKAVCYDAMFKYMKYFPNDTDLSTYKNMTATVKDECMVMECNNGIITYKNTCAKFKVKYPDSFLLYNEASNQQGKGIGLLLLETPMTDRDQGEAIRNSFAIIGTPTRLTTESELMQNFFQRGRLVQDSVRTLSEKNSKSLYFSTHSGLPDEYQGIATLIKHGNYYYQIIYTATVSTFKKNLKLFLEFEHSLSFL
jgi:hypothetical protein